ncbi:MAG: hypothetical protein DWQ04_24380 [Chloroflexi bacterium]|nr:MAG: hypothetical protein DWQ04_24380 [Chloroflexota bacterium]
MHRKQTIAILIILLIITACTKADPTPLPKPTSEPVELPADEPTEVPAPTTESTEEPVAEPVAEETAVIDPATFTWPAPAKQYNSLSRQPVTIDEQITFDELDINLPEERDDVGLAVAYLGVTNLQNHTPPLVTEPLPVGTTQKLFVSTHDTNVTTSPDFILRAVSDHGYFWFDTTPGLDEPTNEALLEMSDAFDEIYEQTTFYFGQESSPGVDGDPRIHIVNASPLSVCNVDLDNAQTCGLLGYVATSNVLPPEVYPTSNQREMFIMNGSVFGSDTYIEVLAHEFRHMIENRYDVNDIDWAVEGSAMLAEDLLGFPADPIARGNLFLTNPDQQLNSWPDGYTIPYYGQGYVMNRFIFNRLGEDLYRVFATHPDPGLLAIDGIAAEFGLDFTGMELWLDWLAALAIHDIPGAGKKYALRKGLQTAVSTPINTFPTKVNTTVNQFAADYYELIGEGIVTLDFTGSNHVPLLDVQPLSGQSMWVANRANYSMVNLTHEFDLSRVSNATLEYAVFQDIEAAFDFAYVSISTDGGTTWQGLVANNMQGTEFEDDPSDVAYTDRFYSGKSNGWLQESVDLTPYTGQAVQIRFEYITDPILTLGGIAFDNIAIPEINFYDDAESDNGWEANGFVRATGNIPQRWHLILITFPNGLPVVEQIPINEDNTVTAEILLDSEGERPLLIVAASSPMTLQSANYQFETR